MTEQDAVTRKVPQAEMIASQDTFRDKPKRYSSLKTVLAAAAAAIVVIVVVTALAMKGKGTVALAPAKATSVPVPILQETLEQQQSAASAAAAAVAVPPPRTKPVPEVIRLVVTAEPLETELSMDGNVLAGHRMNLEVPKDRGIHVVSASAPGYIPFNQQVTFSSDVVLKISLHRSHTPPVHPGAKPRSAKFDPIPRETARPAAVSPGPGLAPGMSLDGPAVRPNAKPIDERNPYKP